MLGIETLHPSADPIPCCGEDCTNLEARSCNWPTCEAMPDKSWGDQRWDGCKLHPCPEHGPLLLCPSCKKYAPFPGGDEGCCSRCGWRGPLTDLLPPFVVIERDSITVDSDGNSYKASDARAPSVEREPGNTQLFEEEVRWHLEISKRTDRDAYECVHMKPPIIRFELKWLRLSEPHPEFGPGQVREITLCVPCYQVLRGAGVAPSPGTWEWEELGGLRCPQCRTAKPTRLADGTFHCVCCLWDGSIEELVPRIKTPRPDPQDPLNLKIEEFFRQGGVPCYVGHPTTRGFIVQMPRSGSWRLLDLSERALRASNRTRSIPKTAKLLRKAAKYRRMAIAVDDWPKMQIKRAPL